MPSVQFKINGLKKLQSKLSGMPDKLVNAVDGEIKATVLDINQDQVRLAPIDNGRLRQTTGFRTDAKMNWSLFSNEKYAAYVEFGTGKLVNIPAGLEDYAILFKGKGIKEVNLPARPFFFTPYLTRKDQLVTNISNIIKKI